MVQSLIEFARDYNYYKIACDHGKTYAEQVLAKKRLEKSAWGLMRHKRGDGEMVNELRDYSIRTALLANNSALQGEELQQSVNNICVSLRNWGVI